jgi:hypothetical protein
VLHPRLHSWREDLPSAFVSGLAVLCGIAVLSVFAAWIFQSPAVVAVTGPAPRPEWIEVARPFPAFALSIPEAADVPESYAIRRHAIGGGRMDILTLGAADSDAPYLQVNVYRPGQEPFHFGDAASEIMAHAGDLGPAELTAIDTPVETKLGPLSIATFLTGKGSPRRCLGFARAYRDPQLQIFGWFCQGGEQFIERSTLACALDRFTLLAAGSEPKIGALFAQAELRRSFCGQRSTLLSPTPKHRALWGALPNYAEPGRLSASR